MSQVVPLPVSSAGEGETLSDHVFRKIQSAIVKGEIAPGSKISELELARVHGISRGPLREAINRLEGQKLLVRVPHVGARVVSLSQQELCELYEIRESLEGMACRLAAERMSPRDVDELRRVLQAHERDEAFQAGRGYYQQEGDYDFHYRIVQGSGNRMLIRMLCDELYQLARMYRIQYSATPNRPRQAYAEHHRILDAIADGDGELAEILMRRHIRASRLNIERQIAQANLQRTEGMNIQYRKPLPGTRLDYFDARAAVEAIAPGAYDRLPYTSRVLAENLVRRCEPSLLEDALRQLIERRRDLDFPWYPARVVCHDILGQTALVDLAGLRDAIAEKGGDPAKVNPVVPVQLIVDHSLAVEHAGFEPDAFEKNRAVEDRRNEDRFHFIDWTRTAFKNVDVIPAGNGIMHQINLEKMSPVIQARDGVAFPDTCVGTDSHTPHVDALGVIAVGVGGLEAETVMLGRASMMRLPDIVGVRLAGRRQPGITATDIVLALTEFLRKERVVGAYVEFFGEGAESLSIGDRATISNMCPEYGATAAMFYIDEQTIDYLTLTGREPEQVALVEQYAKTAGLWGDALEAAEYERVLDFDLGTVTRNMAGPSNPHRRLPTSDLAERGIADPAKLQAGRVEEGQGLMPDGAVIIAAITSCTNTSNPRNVVAAGLLARNANALGLARKPWVKTSFAPGSKVARLYLEESGLLPELEKLGFGIVAYACTTCNGMSGALDPAIQQEIIDRDLYATAVLSGNRNFDGRIHPYAKQAFLASPPLVVAYAIAGTVRFDIERDVLGVADGREIRLKDLWPSDEEIDAIVAASVKPEQFRRVYVPMFDLGQAQEAKSPLYDWRPLSTYIRRPPYWDTEGVGALAANPRTLRGMRPLAILPDNITTDHLSPSNAILASSAAGEYLTKMGVPEEDFNSYATHRGDHLTAMRATLANPKLYNEMVRNDDGSVKQGSLARVEPDGTVMRMWEAIETYMDRRQPLIIVAGADYGQGSSRDWAAKGVRLAGVEAIVAEGFERIHRTNLIGMGVLPLEFKPGTDRKTLGLDGTETYDVIGERRPRADLTLVVHRRDGQTVEVPVTCRLDTAEEVSIYEAGGVLQRFAQDFLAAESGADARKAG